MRTSEIIMLNSPARRVSRACSPEATGTVSNPWLRRNESSRLRWPESSSTIRTRGAFEPFLRGSAGIGLSLGWREGVAKPPPSLGWERGGQAAVEFGGSRVAEVSGHVGEQCVQFTVSRADSQSIAAGENRILFSARGVEPLGQSMGREGMVGRQCHGSPGLRNGLIKLSLHRQDRSQHKLTVRIGFGPA